MRNNTRPAGRGDTEKPLTTVNYVLSLLSNRSMRKIEEYSRCTSFETHYICLGIPKPKENKHFGLCGVSQAARDDLKGRARHPLSNAGDTLYYLASPEVALEMKRA